MSNFAGVTTEICEIAWELTLPSLTKSSDIGVTNKPKPTGTVVVLDPRTGAVLFQARANEDHPDAEKYDEIALAKATVTVETGLPSRKVQQDAPHLYEAGQTKWGGSAIQDGLIVAFSGVQAVFDEAISKNMIAWIIAICQDEMTRSGGVMDSESSFLGEGVPAF